MFKRILQFTYKQRYKLGLIFSLVLIGYYFCLPKKLFDKPYSTVLFDKNGKLLAAKIAADGQWRFPPNDSVPEKFAKALLCFEDKRFYRHWGVDIWALGRALKSNFQQGRRVSGASTISMQTIRLSRDNPRRTVLEKAWEIILATRMEWSYSKDSILNMYASNAPFGGNVVGLDAAAWKYFGRSAAKLSWAEAAMLAVLPNSPSLIHLSKNRIKLKAKRDRLLDRLFAQGTLDSLSCELAKLEPLPEKPQALPRLAPHLLERAKIEVVAPLNPKTALIKSTIDAELQEQINQVVQRHSQRMSNNRIFNAAALVIEIETGDILSYVGNAPNAGQDHGEAVDIIQAPRSSGSILKPILMAAMLQDGEILPHTLYPDIPSQFGGYVPKNYDETYSGAVAVSEVIAKSLNIPTVHMLHQYGVGRFHQKLKDVGMSTLVQNPDHYGLTLILGGAETKLEDLAQIYGGMARSLKHYGYYNGKYAPNSFRPINYLKANSKGRLPSDAAELQAYSPLQAAAVWHSFEAMQAVGRPGAEGYWESFVSSSKVAWKTGTSFGFRDAWAIGVTPEYLVAVWVGNADGEGRPGLVGVQAAGPLLFDIFHTLGSSRTWFDQPFDEQIELMTCRHSGHIAGPFCEEVDTIWAPLAGQRTNVCPYHKQLHLTKDKNYQLHSDCASPSEMLAKNYFILPAAQEWYYKKRHPSYETAPPYREDCKANSDGKHRKMALIYPIPNMKIYVPKNLSEERSRTVFEAAHSNPKSTIYWHLDDQFICSTKDIHEIALNPSVGKHKITLVDEDGERISRFFEILETEG
jgi:penicillin-binding protein 1C